MAVEDVVEDLFAEERHADLVGIGEAERHAHIDPGLILIDTTRLAAGVPARLLHKA